jgi:hypothetical protein
MKSAARRVVDDLRRRAKPILSDRKRRPLFIVAAMIGAVLVALLCWLLLRPPQWFPFSSSRTLSAAFTMHR